MNLLTARTPSSNGTIGIVAPASPVTNVSDVQRGIAWWEAQGYHVALAKGALERADYVAGSPELRAQDLMEMFSDPQIDAIQCLRGGYGSAQVIPFLDFPRIAENPKPFIGFSDITALHTALLHFTGLATFYGPSLTMVGSPTLSGFTAQRLLLMLQGETTGFFPRNPDDPYIQTFVPGKATGRLIGGCLSDLLCTMGTPWELNLDEAIFVFEEVGSSPHGIDRALLQLTQAGKFEKVRGIVVGDLIHCEWNENGGAPWPHTKTLEEVLEERLRPLGVPVVYRFPFGHGKHLATIPLGVQAHLDASTGSLLITEAALSHNSDA